MGNFTEKIAEEVRVSLLDPVSMAIRSGSLGRTLFVMPSTNPDYIAFQRETSVYKDAHPILFTSLSSAIAAASAGRGDRIIVAHDYTEAPTAAIAINKAGLSIIGNRVGNLAPTITVTGTVDGFDISAANVTVDGFNFAAPATDEATSMINVSGARCTLRNIKGIGSTTSKNFVDCITIASGADDLTIDGVEFYNSVVAVNSFLSIEAAVARLRVFNFFAFGDVATAGIIDAATATQIHFKNVTVGVVGSSKPAATLDSNPTGLIEDSRFSGTSTTLANNGALGNAIRLFNVLVLEETDGSKQGAAIPAVDVD